MLKPFAVFAVFANGHTFKVESYEHLTNAEDLARYHQQNCGVTSDTLWFEVWSQGDMCMSTR